MGNGACRCGSVPDDDVRGLGGVEEEHLPFVEEDRHSCGVRCDDGDASTGHKAGFLPRAQRFGIAVGQPVDNSPGGDLESIERSSSNIITGSVSPWDPVPMWVATRVAEHAVEGTTPMCSETSLGLTPSRPASSALHTSLRMSSATTE